MFLTIERRMESSTQGKHAGTRSSLELSRHCVFVMEVLGVLGVLLSLHTGMEPLCTEAREMLMAEPQGNSEHGSGSQAPVVMEVLGVLGVLLSLHTGMEPLCTEAREMLMAEPQGNSEHGSGSQAPVVQQACVRELSPQSSSCIILSSVRISRVRTPWDSEARVERGRGVRSPWAHL